MGIVRSKWSDGTIEKGGFLGEVNTEEKGR